MLDIEQHLIDEDEHPGNQEPHHPRLEDPYGEPDQVFAPSWETKESKSE